jgi:hypothetical protein
MTGALLGDAELIVTNGRVSAAVSGGFVSSQPDRDGGAVAGQEVRTCHALGCAQAADGVLLDGIDYTSRSSRGDVNLLLLVVRGNRPKVTFAGHGWRLVPSTFSFRIAEATDRPLWVAQSGRGVAVTRSARASGGASGSFALLAPPCSAADTNSLVNVGVGRMTLTGGSAPRTTTCPTDSAPLTSYATRATTWKAVGTVAGDATMRTDPLFVIDLPRTLPRPAP